MKQVIVVILTILMLSCAQTTFYKDGRPIAKFQGDMTKMHLTISEDGAIDWKGDVSHSAATIAQATKITNAGTAIGAAGLMTLIK